MKLCVLALPIQRTAEIRAGRSWAGLKNVLERIFAVDCQVQGKLVVRTTKLSAEAVSLSDALGVKRSSPVLEIVPLPKLAWVHARLTGDPVQVGPGEAERAFP